MSLNREHEPLVYPPSVGELIDRADILARDLLYEAPQRDGRAMLRTWGEVVEGAGELWAQLPHRSDVPGTGQDVLDQLQRSARTLHRAAGRGSDVDPTLQEIGGVFTQAARLIARSGVAERREPHRWTEAQLADAFAARVSVMHTLYVSAHAVSVGLANTALQERFARSRTVRNTSAEELRSQVLGVEQIAFSYLHGHYPHALDGRHREPADDTRLPGAIATWDVHTHRTLTQAPTTHALTRVAGTAFKATIYAHALWRAAAESGHVDRRLFENQISPALDTMTERWGQAHAHFDQLVHPHDTSPPELSKAGWQLVDALRETTSNTTRPAAVQDLPAPVDGASLVRSLHRLSATMAGVAEVFRDAVRHAPLLVDARAANTILRCAPDEENRWQLPSPRRAVVAPRDVLHHRTIPLPPVLRSPAKDAAAQAAAASRAGLRSTMTASDGTTDTMNLPASRTRAARAGNRLTTSQKHEQRAIPIRATNVTPLHPSR